MRINKKHIVTILLICVFIPFVFNVQKVQAAYSYKSGSDAVIDKITKYNASQAINIFKNHTDIAAVKNFLHYDKNGDFIDKEASCSVPVPNTIMPGKSDASPTLSCWDFWFGNGSWGALIKGGGSNSNPSTDDAVNYIKQLGYTQDASVAPGGQKCFKVTWTNPNETTASGDAGSFESGSVCAEVDDDGYIWGNSLVYGKESQKPSSTTQYELQIDTSGGAFGSSYVHKIVLNSGPGYNPQFSVVVQDGDNMRKWTDFKSDFDTKLSEHNGTAGGVTGNLDLAVEPTNSGEVSSQITDYTNFTRNSTQKVVNYSGGVLLSEAEVYNIYAKYLTNSSKVKLSCDASYDYDGDAYDWISVQLKRNGKVDSTCHVREISKELYTGGQYLHGSYDPVTNTLTDGAYLFNKRNMSLADIAAAVNKMNLEKLEEDIDDFTGATENVSSEDGETEPTCANSGGAESLGWIVCPILNWLKNAATEVYEKALEPNLRIEPKLFTDADGGAERAWSFFQGMANVLFVILFLVVIFSQLTGVGIDNYGIKKIMPKLIVVAILINLSYLLCVLCVDLSNIVGNGLHNLFDNLPTGSPDGSVAAALGSGAGATAITSVILLAGLGGGALVTWKNPAILISLLIGALGVVIAIFFVFVLLAMREAAVVVLTVISPLAFACYMLPNTKKMYDKWLKFWEGLLLLYPICGALIGGGNFVSNLLLSAGIATQGFWSALTAMLVGIIPIFFIPAALKGAFAAMGTIGSKITGFGDRARSRVTSGARNSDIYKNMQERGRETGIRRRAGYDKNGNRRWGENGPSGFQKFIRGGSRNIERNAQAYQKLQAEKGSLAATNGPDYMLATETANEAKRIVSSGEINTIGKIGAGGLTDGLYKALMSGDRAKINAYSDALSAKGENGRDAVRSAYDKAVGAGMSGTAAKTLANNIMANHAADYKNNNRAMFNVAQSINSGEGGPIDTVSNYAGGHRADLAGKVTASTIGTMDDSAFNEIFGNGEIPAGANSAAIGEIAYKAMSTQNANIKSDRMTKLKKIVESSGYDAPDVQGTNNTGTPKPITVPGAAQEGQAFDVHSLDSDTLLDIATSPNISDNDPNRQAAVEELGKRNIK